MDDFTEHTWIFFSIRFAYTRYDVPLNMVYTNSQISVNN